MSGIYIHIPFCKQACHYCDFHFSTSTKKKDQMVLALAKEIQLRKVEAKEDFIETIYFGGGTPSILTIEDIDFLITTVYSNYSVVQDPEITLEANPDDLSSDYIVALSASPVNRLSIGVQSFFDDDLQLMNRAHHAKEAQQSIAWATRYFDNISKLPKNIFRFWLIHSPKRVLSSTNSPILEKKIIFLKTIRVIGWEKNTSELVRLHIVLMER